MIRQIQLQDYEDILHIKKILLLDSSKINEPNYRVKTEQSGFFTYKKPQTQQEFIKDLQKMHLVYEDEGKVKGYLRIDEEQEMSKSANAFWFKPEMKDLYFSFPHAAMAGVGILPEFAKKGIATRLLTEAIKEVKKKGITYLFSFVALSPMTNIASLLFHEKNGFERIAIGGMPEMFGLKNYQSILYCKRL